MRKLGLAGLVLVILLGSGWVWIRHRVEAQSQPLHAPSTATGQNQAAAPAGSVGSRRGGNGNRVQSVSVAAVAQRDMNVSVQSIGNISATNTVVVRAKVEGEIKQIRFSEGQVVRAGQVLAELDARAYETQLAQVKGQLARDQAQLRNAQLDLQRYRDLLAKDSIASQQVDTQEALVKQLQGTVQIDQALVDNAQLQLSYTKVIAPISGQLGLKLADVGTVARASDTAGIVTITQTQPVALIFSVPETHLPDIVRRLKDKQTLSVEVWDRDQRQSLGQGKVISTDNSIDTTTGTIKLKAELPNADGTLFPNQFVNVRLKLATLKGSLAVPTNAVQRGAQGTVVYVVQPDGTVVTRRVRLGATEGDWVSVQADLNAGDQVVTDGADRLRDGAKVEVIASPTRTQGGFDAASASKAGQTDASPASIRDQSRAAPPAGLSAAQTPRWAGSSASPHLTPKASSPSEGATSTDDLPPWFHRMPPEMQEQFKKMTPEERRAFIEKRREMRRQRQAESG